MQPSSAGHRRYGHFSIGNPGVAATGYILPPRPSNSPCRRDVSWSARMKPGIAELGHQLRYLGKEFGSVLVLIYQSAHQRRAARPADRPRRL